MPATREVGSLPATQYPSTHLPNSSSWLLKPIQYLQSPLTNSWSSKEGFIEIASRVVLIAVILIPVALVGYYISQRWKTETPPSDTPPKPTAVPSRLQSVLSPPKSPYKTPRKAPINPTQFTSPQGRMTPVKRTLLLSPVEATKLVQDDDEEQIKEDMGKIVEAYQTLVNNLHLFTDDDHGKHLEQLFYDFDRTYREHRLYEKYWPVFNKYWMRFSYLQNNYELLWSNYIAGREGHLFIALFNGLNAYLRKNIWPDKTATKPKNFIELSDYLTTHMQEMIQFDPDQESNSERNRVANTLQQLTNSAIDAAIIVFEAGLQCKEDLYLESTPAPSAEEFRDLLKEKQDLDLLKHDIASATYPKYFEFKNDRMKLQTIGSLNMIYVFSQLFPKIKIIIKNNEPFNPEGTFTLTLGVGEQNQFVYVPSI